MKKTSILIALLFWLPLGIGGVPSQSAYDLFQKALLLERADGKLQEAIAVYQRIVKESQDESLAAQAQLRIGMSYEKLGQREAQNAYQSVIDSYPQQIETVKLARQRLANLLKARGVAEKGDGAASLRLVWSEPDIEVTGAPSPDGRYISYTDWNTGNLAVYEIATQKKWPLTANKTWNGTFALNSRWSPDGKKVAYDWWNTNGKEGGLKTIGLDGSKTQTLIDALNVFLADWSPDGGQVLAEIYKERAWSISLVSSADGSIKTLKKKECSQGKMRFSPDGRFIAYDVQSRERADSDIRLLSIDGKTEIPLVEHPATDYLLGWTPDGKYLLFASDRTGTFDAWILPISDGKPQGEPEIVRKNLGYVDPMGFTRDGAFYYGSSSGIQSIFVATVDPDTGLSTAPIRKIPLLYEGRNSDPEFSPDGRKIAYVRSSLPRPSVNVLQAPNSLCIRSLEDGRERVFPLNRYVHYLRWAPDSLSILVFGRDQERRNEFTRLDVNTGQVTALVQSKDPSTEEFLDSPEWSDNGKGLVYLHINRIKSTSIILHQNLETGQTKTIHQLDLQNGPTLTISPDNRWLAIIEQPRKSSERIIRIIPAEGGEIREVCRFQAATDHMIQPRFSADGRYILYHSIESQENRWELWRVPFKGGQPQKTGIAVSRDGISSLHPDGRQIIFMFRGSSPKPPEIWVMENFLPRNRLHLLTIP